jgi:rhodanese-related sulfurtransferase
MSTKSALAIAVLVLSSISLAHSTVRRDLAGAQTPQSGAIERISAEELKTKLAKQEHVTVLDVRGTDSYVAADNRIKGSIHVKLRRLRYRLAAAPLKDVPRDSEVVTYCACPSDEASYRAAQVLLNAGFKRVRVLEGGWQMWLKAKGPVEPRPKA